MKKEKIGYEELLVRIVLEDKKNKEQPFTTKEIQEETTLLRTNSGLLHLVDKGTIIAYENEDGDVAYCHKERWKKSEEKD